MLVFIRPLDTQFYRSGLPFDAGENDEAVSFFPPYPRTLYGAFRARGILASGGDFNNYNGGKYYGDDNGFGSFELKGPIYCRKRKESQEHGSDEIILPIPLDVVKVKDNSNLIHLIPLQGTNDHLGWDLGNSLPMLLDQMNVEEPLGGPELKSLMGEYLLPFNTLGRNYLVNNDLTYCNVSYLLKEESVFCTEDRIGIARDVTTGTVIEGRLYRAPHIRMNDKVTALHEEYGLLVKLDNYDEASFPEHGLIQLGGESRAAHYSNLSNDETSYWWEKYEEEIKQKIAETGQFKAYFITPAIFQKGSLPDVCGTNPYIEISHDGETFRFKLLSLCSAKPKMIAGWDIKKKRPKPMRLAIPEGSVYFFRYEGSVDKGWESIDEEKRKKVAGKVYDAYNFETWCSREPWDDEFGPGKEGFGITLIGGW